VIEVKEVSKRFGDTLALDGVSLSLEPGTVLGLVGHSGSGKTTLLRIIAGLLAPGSGTVVIDGVTVNDPMSLMAPRLRGVSMVFQSPALWPHMTVDENIRFTLEEVPRVEQDQRIRRLLSASGLTDLGSRYPGQLSGGEARRVSVLRALAPGKPYVLMDEPLVNLDPELKAEILSLIKAETTGRGVLYVTHDASELEGFADTVLRLRGGRVEG
jgi:iron(III) transport system ATP-binding protein